MLPLALIVAALFGGGFALKRAIDKGVVTPGMSSDGITSKPYDEFLELRSDGLLQFNRQTAISILGWLGSVSTRLKDAESTPIVTVFRLLPSPDGSPPAEGKGASRELLNLAKEGKVILVSRDITLVNRPERKAVAVSPDKHMELFDQASQRGQYANLIVPSEEKVAPTLPALPGYTASEPDSFPGQKPLPLSPSEELPLDLRRQVDDLLKRVDSQPAALQSVARQLRLGGYNKEADLLDQRAADHRAMAIAKATARELFVIPAGHPGAIEFCKRVAGSEQKIADLLAVNPVLVAKTSDKGVEVFPWTPGQVVSIPPSWGGVKG
jgi:hypothetical protein